MNEEGLKSTLNHKIFIGQQIPVDRKAFLAKINRLHQVIEQDKQDQLIPCLQDLVPTFLREPIVGVKFYRCKSQKEENYSPV